MRQLIRLLSLIRLLLYDILLSLPHRPNWKLLSHVVNVVCAAVALTFVLHRPGWVSWWQKHFPETKDPKSLIPMLVMGVPLLLGTAVRKLVPAERCSLHGSTAYPSQPATVLPRRLRNLARSFRYCFRGNTAVDTTTIFNVAMILAMSYSILSTLWSKGAWTVKTVANAVGLAALVTLALFSWWPVAKHNATLQALPAHIWAGRLVLAFGCTHSGLYIYKFMMLDELSVTEIFAPSLKCMTANDESCYARWVNLTGLATLASLIFIGITSLDQVRRRRYDLFYLNHVVFGTMVVLSLFLHWKRCIPFLLGSILMYLTSSAPVWIENFLCLRRGGVQLVEIEPIGDCMALTFAATDSAILRFVPGQYVKLSCPQISNVSHPFTINRTTGRENQLRITFRVTGTFTKALVACASNDPPPLMCLDGFYGDHHRMECLASHDKLVLIAGGIGITPYLSLLHILAVDGSLGSLRSVTLHWICRDEKLITSIAEEYLNILPHCGNSESSRLAISVVVHKTGSSQMGDDLEDSSERMLKKRPMHPRGTAFTPSAFSTASNPTAKHNCPVFVSFSVSTAMGLGLGWKLYGTLEKSMLSRVVVSLLLVGWCLLSAILALWASHRFAVAIIDVEGYSGLEDDGVELSTTRIPAVTTAKSETRLSLLEGMTRRSATVRRSSGRPQIALLVTDLEGSLQPAVGVCGPRSLTQEVKRVVDSRLVRPVLYEEHFML